MRTAEAALVAQQAVEGMGWSAVAAGARGPKQGLNLYPDQIPSWLVEWIPPKGGYFIGNLQPAHMDF